MNDGYKAHFKKLGKSQSNHTAGRGPLKKERRQKDRQKMTAPTQNSLDAEKQIREMLKNRSLEKSSSRKAKTNLPWSAVVFSVFGFCIAVLGFIRPETFVELIDSVKISSIGRVMAAEDGKKKTDTKVDKEADRAGEKRSAKADPKAESKKSDSEEVNYFSKLGDRKRELDQRERELNELESELHKQKLEIEARIQKLSMVREQIASILKERVELDEEKIKKLVDFYANMKPGNAAKILTNINEDLAVEVLGRMKKKSAADIMNLLEPKKARTLSEKFAGYKRR